MDERSVEAHLSETWHRPTPLFHSVTVLHRLASLCCRILHWWEFKLLWGRDVDLPVNITRGPRTCSSWEGASKP